MSGRLIDEIRSCILRIEIKDKVPRTLQFSFPCFLPTLFGITIPKVHDGTQRRQRKMCAKCRVTAPPPCTMHHTRGLLLAKSWWTSSRDRNICSNLPLDGRQLFSGYEPLVRCMVPTSSLALARSHSALWSASTSNRVQPHFTTSG